MELTAEHQRLNEHRDRKANWKKWGPYLSERSWGTVREDYSADGAAWMGFYCLVLLKISLELAQEDPVYQDTASKFFEHFLRIARAMTGDYRGGLSLWNEDDAFFYDALHIPDGRVIPQKVRSLVGLMPLLAVETFEHDLLESLPVFKRRLNWSFENRLYLRDGGDVACTRSPGQHSRRLIKMFLRNGNGERPIYGGLRLFQDDPHWRDHILFNEYFHSDNGAGLGASHQTGWTGVVAKLIQQSGGWQDKNIVRFAQNWNAGIVES